MQFRPDGTLVEYTYGRADVPEEQPAGHWTKAGTLTRATASPGRIVTATPDRLEIRWED